MIQGCLILSNNLVCLYQTDLYKSDYQLKKNENKKGL